MYCLADVVNQNMYINEEFILFWVLSFGYKMKVFFNETTRLFVKKTINIYILASTCLGLASKN